MQCAVLGRLVAAGGRVVPTDRLIDDLWNGDPPTKAVAALQVYIHNLRRVFEPDRPRRARSRVIVSESHGYALNLEPAQVDSWHFEQLLHGHESAMRDPAGRPDPLEQCRVLDEALACWHGTAFESFAGMPWAAQETARLAALRLTAAELRAQAALEMNRPAEVVLALRPILEEHPGREECARLLALAQYRLGQSLDALATVRRSREFLTLEFGVDPGPGLRDLETAILTHSVNTDPPPAPLVVRAPEPESAPAPDPVPDSGYAEQRAAILAAAEIAAAGHVRLVWLFGEAGAGKTTLAKAITAQLADRSWTTVFGRCPEVEGAPPAWAWAEVLTGLDDADPETYTAADAFTLARRVVRSCRERAARTPVAIVLEDVHGADTATLQVLRQVVNWLRDRPILIVATLRGTEAGPGVRDTAAALALFAGDRVELDGLDLAGTRRAAVAAGLTALDDRTVALLRRRTGGNPLFIRELAKLVATQGTTIGLPDTVRALLGRRVAQLPADVTELLQHMSIWGEDCDIATLSAATARSSDAVIDLLATAESARLLRTDRTGRLAFDHALIRETVYYGIPLLRRSRMHWAAFELLRDQRLGTGDHRPDTGRTTPPAAGTTRGQSASGAALALSASSAALGLPHGRDTPAASASAAALAFSAIEGASAVAGSTAGDPGREHAGPAQGASADAPDDDASPRSVSGRAPALSVTDAALSATDAALSATDAALSATDAALPATDAALPATDAALSSTGAALPATDGALSAIDAALSATDGAPSATDAALSSTGAALPATDGALSAIDAVLSATDGAPSAPDRQGLEADLPESGAAVAGGRAADVPVLGPDDDTSARHGAGGVVREAISPDDAGRNREGVSTRRDTGIEPHEIRVARWGGELELRVLSPEAAARDAATAGAREASIAGRGRDIDALAHHAALGASPETAVQALEFVRAAARRCVERRMRADAVRRWRSVLALHELAGHAEAGAAREDRQALLEARCELVTALAYDGQHMAARAVREQAIELAEALGETALLARAATCWPTPLIWSVHDWHTPDPRIREPLRIALGDPELPVRRRIRALVTTVFDRALDDPDAARETAAAALTLAEELGDPELVCTVVNAQAFAAFARGGFLRAHEVKNHAAQLLRIATEARLTEFRALAHYLLFRADLADADLVAADAHARSAAAYSTDGQLRHLLDAITPFDMVLELLRGNVDEALRMLQDGTSAAEEIVAHSEEGAGEYTRDPNALHIGIAISIGWLTNDLSGLAEDLGRRMAIKPELFAYGHALALVHAGREEAARRVLAADPPMARQFWSSFTATRARVCLALGDLSAAREIYDQLLPYAGSVGGLETGATVLGPMDHVLADLAAALGHPERAAAHRADGDRLQQRLHADLAVLTEKAAQRRVLANPAHRPAR
ncbi:BTAD domain-containing putative transcriptional regulator [Nocardia sp. IFM 10818]